MKHRLLKVVLLVGIFFLLNNCNSSLSSPEPEALAEGGNGKKGGIVVGMKHEVSPLTGASNEVAIDAGYASDGTAIPVPEGFTMENCRFTAAVSSVEGSVISSTASVDTTSSDDQAFIYCKKVVQERAEIPAETKSCSASFTMLCVQ